jgi:hypothetical protein
MLAVFRKQGGDEALELIARMVIGEPDHRPARHDDRIG